ncbi:helix-hairpin-helix domain-containing protein [Photobacterium sp. 1_MG-2023]|uniref:ComEA family DNA-binding protein n=1 Tax=Photobacterium sp. 1_MG-2023 TaxID=3062646 RepID=UPI0026E46E44|nr:helix-hairpin-helix domain-containing protein [Photobacterium sp. 1_MG-2023]MDO6707131.1 helix-hairpin-helix domain-containing protein [Photobacterium sp. 1_MG-2023]
MLAASMVVPGIADATTEHEGIEIVVNINTANVEELDKLLLGVGPDKAQSIVAFREAHGNFSTIEDLSKVKGIGASTVEKNRARIQL